MHGDTEYILLKILDVWSQNPPARRPNQIRLNWAQLAKLRSWKILWPSKILIDIYSKPLRHALSLCVEPINRNEYCSTNQQLFPKALRNKLILPNKEFLDIETLHLIVTDYAGVDTPQYIEDYHIKGKERWGWNFHLSLCEEGTQLSLWDGKKIRFKGCTFPLVVHF